MRNKIKSITEKITQDRLHLLTPLPNGLYNGVWGGYAIELTSEGKHYELATEKGVRGIGIKVVVQIENGIATFDMVR